MNAELTIARHGHACCNQDQSIAGPTTCRGLTTTGRAQARRLAARLAASTGPRDVTAVYSSPVPRARETAALLAGALGLPVLEEPDLREPDYGSADGRTWADVVAAFGAAPALHPDKPIAPGAETWNQHQARVHHTLRTLLTRHTEEHLLVVAHGETVTAAHHLFAGVDTLPIAFAVDQTSMTTWRRQPVSWLPPATGSAGRSSGTTTPLTSTMTSDPTPRPLRDRRIVVTGANGAIGRHLVRRLVASGTDVLGVDLAPGSRDLPGQTVPTVTCDIRSPRLRDAVQQHEAETVVHLAAQVRVPHSIRRPHEDADANICGTIAVAEAAAATGAHLVFAASCAIYGHPQTLPVAETAPLAPISPYGLSKATGVHYLEWFARDRGLPVTCLILGNVYGAGSAAAVVDTFVADAVKNEPSLLHGTGETTRDFVHIDDVTTAFAAACTAPAAGRVNVGTGTETSIKDVLDEVQRGASSHVPTRRGQARPGDIPRMRLDISRARTHLNWQPHIKLQTGIVLMLRQRAAA